MFDKTIYYGKLSWQPHFESGTKPIYKAIVSALENDINCGILKAGDRLPPQRELADYLGVNFTTITRAYKLCEQRGLICACVGKGTFISADVNIKETTDDKEAFLLDLGRIHALSNTDQYLSEAIIQVTKRMHVINYFSYDEPKSHISYQEVGANWIKRFRFNVKSDDVFITSGTQNALAIILLSLFQPGDKIGTTQLTYTGFKSIAGMIGIQLVPINTDSQGLLPDMLEHAYKIDGIKGLYIMPECQNPTTCTLSIERRKTIAEIVQKNDLILIEDDTMSFLENTDFPPVSSFAPENSLYISGTSKALSVGLRTAFLYAPSKFHENIKRGIYNINLTNSHFNVEIISTLLSNGSVDTIIKEKQVEAEKRNQIVNEILSGFQVYGNKRDYFRWLILPEHWTGSEFELCARSAGIQVFSADRFMVGNGPTPSAIRISTSAIEDIREFKKGLTILKQLLLTSSESTKFTI
jgi:DNA-binding transcriptional MocR family regulator